MSNRVLVFRVGSPPKMKAVVFWTCPGVNALEISDAIKLFAEHEGPIAEVELVTWHHCQTLFEKMKSSSIDLRVDLEHISARLLRRDLVWETHGATSDIQQLLKQGYEWLFRKHGGILVAPEGYHYEKPSHVHSTKFLRAANVLVNSNESALFAIGVLIDKKLSNAPDIIYTDTSAINAVGHAISDFFMTKDLIFPIPVVSFGSYEGLSRGFSFGFIESALILMSATTTGALEKKLCDEYDFPRHCVATLFAANKLQEQSALFNMSDIAEEPFGEIENYYPSDCPLCKKQMPVIIISGDQFLPGQAVCRPFEIKTTSLPSDARRFINDIGNDKVACNVLTPNGSRRVFDFNLFSGKECSAEKEIKRQFQLLFASSHQKILVPSNLRVDLAWTNSNPYNVSCTDNFGELLDPAIVGVFCPVNFGGSEIASMALFLRSFKEDPARSFLLGVSVYSSSEERKETISSLEFRKRGWKYLISNIYELYLPSWRHGITPWESELDWWLKFKNTWQDLPDIERRVQLLSNLPSLEGQNLFLPDFSGAAPRSSKGFAFFDSESEIGDQARIYLTMCLVLHQNRMDKKSWSTTQNRSVLEPRMFNRFSDPAIQSSILRGCMPEELNYAGDENLSARFEQILGALIAGKGTGYAGALNEFLYAVLSERVHLEGFVRMRVLKEITLLKDIGSPWADCFAKIAKIQLDKLTS